MFTISYITVLTWCIEPDAMTMSAPCWNVSGEITEPLLRYIPVQHYPAVASIKHDKITSIDIVQTQPKLRYRGNLSSSDIWTLIDDG